MYHLHKKIKENLKRMILEMAQDEISNYSSQKGVQKYFEGNIDKIINENIKNYLDDISVNKIYSKIFRQEPCCPLERFLQGW